MKDHGVSVDGTPERKIAARSERERARAVDVARQIERPAFGSNGAAVCYSAADCAVATDRKKKRKPGRCSGLRLPQKIGKKKEKRRTPYGVDAFPFLKIPQTISHF